MPTRKLDKMPLSLSFRSYPFDGWFLISFSSRRPQIPRIFRICFWKVKRKRRNSSLFFAKNAFSTTNHVDFEMNQNQVITDKQKTSSGRSNSSLGRVRRSETDRIGMHQR